MKKDYQHKNPLKHEGTSQQGRQLKDQDPNKVVLHNLGSEEWLEFAHEMSDDINYYSNDGENPTGTWQDFFKNKEEVKQYLQDYKEGQADPFFGLFIGFLKLLSFPQKSINDLPRRHLDYYYKEILRLKEKPSRPDKVHVLFELTKNAKDFLIEEGTILDAGKNESGEALHYEIINPVVVNSAKVAVIRSIYSDGKSLKYTNYSSISEAENEKEGNHSWEAFGDARWSKMQASFYISSHLLSLKEGERNIQLELQFKNKINPALFGGLEIHFTGEKEWIITNPSYVISKNEDVITLSSIIDSEEKAVINYDEEIHQKGLKTKEPAMMVIFKNLDAYSEISSMKLKKVSLKVDVKNIKSLEVRNEQGILDPKNPFMPFGSSPIIGSKLKVGYDEMRKKAISQFKINMKWLGVPQNFSDHYANYGLTPSATLVTAMPTATATAAVAAEVAGAKGVKSATSFFGNTNISIDEEARKLKKEQTNLEIKIDQASNVKEIKPLEVELFFSQKPQFKVEVQANEMISKVNTERQSVLYSTDYLKNKFKVTVSSPFPNKDISLFNEQIQNSGNSTSNVEIELTLLQDFYHKLYNKVYVAKTLQLAKLPSVDIKADSLPNLPYTPLLEELTLDYTAEISRNFELKENENQKELSFFLQHPFGIEKTESSETLVPNYRDKHLFIGLEKMQAGKNISLLFQVDEGSENPEISATEPLQWSVLSGNKSINLEKKNIVRNDTNEFLRSGIVELQIPHAVQPEAGIMNPIAIGNELMWLRITQKSPLQSTAKLIGIHAQAATAIRKSSNINALTEWRGLPPKTISQLVYRRSAIKKVEQPYTSFGGAGVEMSADFYRRVSERLRHKDRAISIWDYEHLVLEQFPELYKVKCLNHTILDSKNNELKEFCPGEVTLIVIPKITSTESSFRFEPKISKDNLSEIKDFLSKRISSHVNIHVLNPVYEKVRFEFEIQFNSGLDFEFYKIRAEEDLKKLLSPWAYDISEDMKFDTSFSIFEIIHYLEKLEYVDYIKDFKMFHPIGDGEKQKTIIQPNSPLSILISEKHTIKPLTNIKC